MVTEEQFSVANNVDILQSLRKIYIAYGKTDMPSFCGYMLGHARAGYRAFLLLSIAASIIVILLRLENSFPFSLSLVISALLLRKDAFRKYKDHPAIQMNLFLNHNQGYRYLIFREAVPREMLKNETVIQDMLRLLKQRQRVRQTNAFFKNPVASSLIALSMMFIGALVSRFVELGIQVSVFSLISIFILLVVLWPFLQLFRSRAYKDEELAEFVFWLSVDGR